MPLQMKQEGLLRTLLVQILRQIPEIIAAVAPRKWESLCLMDEDPLDWSNQELQHTLRRAISNLGDDTKLCLFVDGLDEFDGNLNELISLFKHLIQYPNVKLCASSRPWVEFEDAFKHAPSLMLQDLTHSDITHYVSSTMESDPRFDLLRKREPIFASQLVENIVTKSSGVFLWTRLVVPAILGGIGYGDRVSDLQSRLEALPAELELLYDKIHDSIDPTYLEHAAQLFKLVKESKTPPNVHFLSFADDMDGWRKAIDHPLLPMAAGEAEVIHDTMRRRINSRCRGFLEIKPQGSITSQELNPQWERGAAQWMDLENCTVQYLHRTVKDYIESADVQRKLILSMKSSYDRHFAHCVGLFILIRTRPLALPLLRDVKIWTLIDQFLYHASKVESPNYAPLLSMMDSLNSTCSLIAQRSVGPTKDL